MCVNGRDCIRVRYFEPPGAVQLARELEPRAEALQSIPEVLGPPPLEEGCVAGIYATSGATAASITEQSHIRGAGDALQWRGANGKWYRAGWGGNKWTGGRNAVVAAGRAARVASRGLGVTGMAFSAAQAAGGIREGDIRGAAWSVIDAAAGAVGTFGGPVGLGMSVGYFGARYAGSC